MKLIVGNLKMNLLQKDIDNYINKLKDVDVPNVVFCPSSIYLKQFIDSGYQTGSQDIGFVDFGAYTGDISISQLKEIGIKYAIIGHSERRTYYNEGIYSNNEISLALKNDIIPILCIGEKKEERNSGHTKEILEKEIEEALRGIDSHLLKDIIIAYEPIWSIGTNVIPSNEEIYETVNYIKNYVKNKYQIDVNVLYGGSVNVDNIKILEKIENINGYLVGGCSIDVEKFLQLIEIINKKI